LLFLLGPAVAQAEIVYVTDVLRVNLRAEASSSSRSIGVVISGERLEALKRQGGYLKVRTKSATEGWIKASYVTPDAPARTQLPAVQAQLATAQDEVRALKEKSTPLGSETHGAAVGHPSTGKGKAGPATTEDGDKGIHWLVWLVAAGLLAVASFALGAMWQQKNINKRLRGLRI